MSNAIINKTEATGFDDVLKPVFWVVFGYLAYSILKYAWVGEDSYIAWRVADNFIKGHGLRWNIDERVQVYTDPLFLLLVSFFYALTDKLYLSVVFLSLVLSSGAVWLAVRLHKPSYAMGLLGLIWLCSSKSWLDYATSGLENPLNYVLMVLFAAEALRADQGLKHLSRLTLLGSLAAFNRLDCIIFCLPLLVYSAYQTLWHLKEPVINVVVKVFIFSAPLWGWVLFSLFYYGFVFPNTYYSKLNAGIPGSKLWDLGPYYFLESLQNDTVTLLGIAICLAATFMAHNLRAKLLAGGVALYLLYVCSVGGDFMAGRFFSVAVMVCIPLLFTLKMPAPSALVTAVICIGIGLTVPRPALLPAKTDYDYNKENFRRIADERAFYFPDCGLFPFYSIENPHPRRVFDLPELQQVRNNMLIVHNIGYKGFGMGPALYVIDPFALGDAFLSKLPINWVEGYRVGHYERVIPYEYFKSLEAGRNIFTDSVPARLYNDIMLATRAPLFAPGRFAAITRLNTGKYTQFSRHWVPEKTFNDWGTENADKIPVPESPSAFFIVFKPDVPGKAFNNIKSFVSKGAYKLVAELKAEADSGVVIPEGKTYAEIGMDCHWPEYALNQNISSQNVPIDGQFHAVSKNFSTEADLMEAQPRIKTFASGVRVTLRRMRIVWLEE